MHPCADRIAKALKERRLTYKQVATESGLGLSTVWELVNERVSDPKHSTVTAMQYAEWQLLGPDPRANAGKRREL